MGLRDILRKKKERWDKERDERSLQKTGYKMAYKEALKAETSKAVREQSVKNARADARATIAKRFPGRGKAGGRGSGIVAGLGAMSDGAMGSMGFGPSIASRTRPRKKRKSPRKRKRRSAPRRQPEPRQISFF